jgi:phage repressor protein C with HTH and peptisase S24 domain
MQAMNEKNYAIDDIRDRIKFILEEKSLNANELAKAINVSRTAIYDIVGGKRNKPGAELLEKIVIAIDDINSNWLLTGKGIPFTNKGSLIKRYSTAEESPPDYPNSNATPVGFLTPTATVRYLPEMMVSAGYADMLASTQIELLPVSFQPTAEEQKKGVAVKIYGDSMEPAIQDGATVFLMPLTHGQWLRISKGVFFFDTDSTLTIKRIAQNNLLGTPATITLQADNPKYPNLTVPAESIRAIWKVTHILNQPVH